MNVILVEENVLILGNFPWEHAQESDVYYNEYIEWHRHHQLQRRFKLPSQWYKFSNRLMRLFRKMLGKEKLNIYFEYKSTFFLDPESLKRCEMSEISKYYDDRWINDYLHTQRRLSNEDEGVEEDFSSSGSGIESNAIISNTRRNTDFEELTQMMKNSLTASFDNSISNENRKFSSTITKTYC